MYLKIIATLAAFIVTSYGDFPCNKVLKDYGYVCMCNSTYCDTINPPPKLSPGQFHFYYTSKENPGFNHNTGHFRMQAFSPYGFRYKVDKKKVFQKIRGFGGSFTDSFGAVVNTLSKDAGKNLLNSFFSENGVEYSVCRVVIGSSDFSLRSYNYLPEYDPTLKTFNLTEDDYIYKIAHMKAAMNISKKPIHFIGTSWNAPDWMKMKNTTKTGFLKPEFRQLWADYFVKTLSSYRSEGIEFWALTTGNEPVTLFLIPAMEVLVMFPEEQREWILTNLGPALEKANYSTKVIVLDDMRLYATWWMDVIMRDPMSKKYVNGIGLHFYSDLESSPEALDLIHENYPEQEIIYSESSINVMMSFLDQNNTGSSLKDVINRNDSRGGPAIGSWARGSFYARNIIENLNHWTTTYVDWNLALNEAGGPNANNFPCDASIIVNNTEDEFYKQPMFYAMGHFSKFIQPDSVIIKVEYINVTQDQNLGNTRKAKTAATQPHPTLSTHPHSTFSPPPPQPTVPSPPYPTFSPPPHPTISPHPHPTFSPPPHPTISPHPHPTFSPPPQPTVPSPPYPTFSPPSHPTFSPPPQPTVSSPPYPTFSPPPHPTISPRPHPTFSPPPQPTVPSPPYPTFFPPPHPTFSPHPHPTFAPLSQDIQFVGALNINGSVSVIFLNPKSSPAEVEVYDPDRGYAYLILEPNSLSTMLYW